MTEKIRVLQFPDFVSRHDFVDTVVRYANPDKFTLGVCVRGVAGNVVAPVYSGAIPFWVIAGPQRSTLPKTVWQLAAILRRWKANILHTHHFDQAVIGWLATRLHPATRLVIGRHYSDAIYRLPAQGFSPNNKRILLRIEQMTNRGATRIIVPSNYIKEILCDWQHISPEKVDLIRYGFDPDKYEAITEADIKQTREEFQMDGHFVIGTFARLSEEKGHRYLIRALKKVREKITNLLCLIVGEGSERAAIEREIAEAGVADIVKLTGWRRDGIKIMAAVDLVVQPTLQEAFSQAMVEALWLNKPLIITDVSGAADIIRTGENGIIIPKGDEDALADSLVRLATDQSLRATLGRAGRQYVQETFVIDKMIQEYEAAYLRAVGV
ncbi:MAG TPA: glycosyltransferase family 4 protein [Pyrinomonadaceae bacterium]|nr:glycosyltransferase family 4 protein [Pyrinomonadaceae bacterium]